MEERRNPGADATGLIQSLEAQAPDSLLRRDVAEQFVRGFVFRIFRAVWDEKRLGFASVSAESEYAANILAGQVQGAKFSIDPTWHPDRLVAFVRK